MTFPCPWDVSPIIIWAPYRSRNFFRAADEDLYRFYADYRWGAALPQSYHERLLHRQREYLFIGGMPEALKVYLETGSYNAAHEVHRSILDTYIDDFAKYARKAELARLRGYSVQFRF